MYVLLVESLCILCSSCHNTHIRFLSQVQFIVIDNRYHRMDESTYAGPEQMAWLEQVLQTSTKTWKIIVHGGTIRRNGAESWFERSKPERRQLLDFIASKNIVSAVTSYRVTLYACRHLILTESHTFIPLMLDWSDFSWRRHS